MGSAAYALFVRPFRSFFFVVRGSGPQQRLATLFFIEFGCGCSSPVAALVKVKIVSLQG